MRIVIFSQYFPPELGACANRIELFAKGLAKKGCDVTVVAGMPNYPFGKIFDGYKGKLFKRENYNGVEVFRAWVFPSRRKNLLGRTLNYLSYFFSALIISLFLRKADVIIASIQPFTVGFVGLFFRFVKGGKLVVDVRDIVEEGSELFQWKSISRGAPKLEKSLLKRANLIITVTSKLVEYIKGYLNDKRNVYLVENSVDLDMIMKSSTSIDRAQFGWEGKFVLIYAGNIGYRHNVGFIIDVAREAQRKGVEELLFLIIGDGVEKDMVKRKALELENVIFLDPMPKEKVLGYIKAADAFFATLADCPFMDFALPAKILDPMALGKPVIAAFPQSKTKWLSSFLPIIFLPHDDPSACLNQILKLKSQLKILQEAGYRGLEVIRQRFDSKKRIDYLYSLIKELQKS